MVAQGRREREHKQEVERLYSQQEAERLYSQQQQDEARRQNEMRQAEDQRRRHEVSGERRVAGQHTRCWHIQNQIAQEEQNSK